MSHSLIDQLNGSVLERKVQHHSENILLHSSYVLRNKQYLQMLNIHKQLTSLSMFVFFFLHLSYNYCFI